MQQQKLDSASCVDGAEEVIRERGKLTNTDNNNNKYDKRKQGSEVGDERKEENPKPGQTHKRQNQTNKPKAN